MDQDIPSGLKAYARFYHLIPERVDLTDPVAIAAAVSRPRPEADLLALVRGGGNWFSVLADRDVCTAVAQQEKLPIVSAVGHTTDRPLVQDLVHQAFETPSLFGTWLRDRAATATDETAQELQAAKETQRASDVRAQKLEQRQKANHLAWGAVVVVVILVAILIALGTG